MTRVWNFMSRFVTPRTVGGRSGIAPLARRGGATAMCTLALLAVLPIGGLHAGGGTTPCSNPGSPDPACSDGDACTGDRCGVDNFCHNPLIADFDPAEECCDPGTGFVQPLSDGDPCTTDSCGGPNGRGAPTHIPAAAGTPCADDSECTFNDACDGLRSTAEGGCGGTPFSAITCDPAENLSDGVNPGCLAATGNPLGCTVGTCACFAQPDLFFLVNGVDAPLTCVDTGEMIEATVRVGPSPSIVNGAQFVVEYDPTCLAYVSTVPGGPPYTLQIDEIVDDPPGTVFYAVGVELGGIGVAGDANLAVLTFQRLAGCDTCTLCFGGDNIRQTYLVDDQGDAILVTPHCSGAIKGAGGVTVSVPPSVTTRVECNGLALVTWASPTGAAECGPASLLCAGEHIESGAIHPPGVVMGGGWLPLGVNQFCCVATNECGDTATDCWTVTVGPMLEMSPTPEGFDKNRYISFIPAYTGQFSALRVRLVSLNLFPSFNGQYRWVGAPSTIDPIPGDPFVAAPLKCTPHFRNWDNTGLMHVYGAEVVPNSLYEVQQVSQRCNLGFESSYTPPLPIHTGLWGDIVALFGAGQPNFVDIGGIVATLNGKASAPARLVSQLQPNVPNPAVPISLRDVSACVDAFRSTPYPYAGPAQCSPE